MNLERCSHRSPPFYPRFSPTADKAHAVGRSTSNMYSRKRGRSRCHPPNHTSSPYNSATAQHSHVWRVAGACANTAGGIRRCKRPGIRAPGGVGYFASRRLGTGRVQGGLHFPCRPSGGCSLPRHRERRRCTVVCLRSRRHHWRHKEGQTMWHFFAGLWHRTCLLIVKAITAAIAP